MTKYKLRRFPASLEISLRLSVALEANQSYSVFWAERTESFTEMLETMLAI